MSLVELVALFPANESAEAWFELQRWLERICCPDCASVRYSAAKNRKPMPYRCRDCHGHFSVRNGTVMQSSKLSYQKGAFSIHLVATSLKGVSGICRSFPVTAWGGSWDGLRLRLADVYPWGSDQAV